MGADEQVPVRLRGGHYDGKRYDVPIDSDLLFGQSGWPGSVPARYRVTDEVNEAGERIAVLVDGS